MTSDCCGAFNCIYEELCSLFKSYGFCACTGRIADLRFDPCPFFDCFSCEHKYCEQEGGEDE